MTSVKYIGLDVHKESISICVRNSVGKVVMESIIATTASTVLQFIDRLRGDLRVTFEEKSWAACLHDLLKPRVSGVEVCNLRKNALLEDGSKRDRPSAKCRARRQSRFIAGLLKTVEEVNSTAEYMFRIPILVGSGSYVRGELLLSDVDIALEWEAKWSFGTSAEQFQALRTFHAFPVSFRSRGATGRRSASRLRKMPSATQKKPCGDFLLRLSSSRARTKIIGFVQA